MGRDGKANDKPASSGLIRLYPDIPTMALHDVLDDSQSQSGPPELT